MEDIYCVSLPVADGNQVFVDIYRQKGYNRQIATTRIAYSLTLPI